MFPGLWWPREVSGYEMVAIVDWQGQSLLCVVNDTLLFVDVSASLCHTGPRWY